ncbi:MAG: hypothetical protein HZA00_06985 [Nitrospinae bacterium]|nr:hypothetical protein [Nitrospinota bacterium]
MNTSSNDTGSIAFNVDWQNAPTTTQKPYDSVGQGFSPAYAPIDCTAAGISTVSATVYDSSNNSIATDVPHNCSAHSGSISSIPAGSGLKLILYFSPFEHPYSRRMVLLNSRYN